MEAKDKEMNDLLMKLNKAKALENELKQKAE